MRWVGRLAIGAATAGVVLFSVVVAVQLGKHPGEALAGAGAPVRLLQVVTGLAVWGAGLDLALRRSRRASGWLLMATGVALLAGALPLPSAGSAFLFTAGLAVGVSAPSLAGAAGLLLVDPRPRASDVALAAAAVFTGLFVAGVLPALLFDPRATGCFECPRNLLLLHGDPAVRDGLVRDGLVASAAACAALAVLVSLRLWRRPELARRYATPTVVPLIVATAFGAAMFGHDASAGEPLRDGTNRTLWLLMCGSLAVAAAGVFAEAVRARLLRRRIASIVLEALPAPEELRAELATALGDPDLEIVFPTSDGPVVDSGGREVPPPGDGAAVTRVRRHGRVIAELRYGAGLADARPRVAAAARGAAPALEHAAVHARLRAELRELHASRSRLIDAADRERRRLERDLHDGAQQRLIALSVAIQDDAARRELLVALEELRDIAHGIHPVALSEAGLAAAIHDLADGSRVPLRLVASPPGRLPPPVESAAHRLVADAVDCAERDGDGRAVEVEIARANGLLRTSIRVPGVDPRHAAARLEHSADRFAALGGELTVEAGTVIEGRLPCAS